MSAKTILNKLYFLMREELGGEFARGIDIIVNEQASFWPATSYRKEQTNTSYRVIVDNDGCQPRIDVDHIFLSCDNEDELYHRFKTELIPQLAAARHLCGSFDPIKMGI